MKKHDEAVKMGKNIAERVKDYLARKDIPKIPLERQGTYMVMGGYPSSGDRPLIGIFRGRYIDVLAHAVQHEKFAGWYLSSDDSGNPNAGLVKEYSPPNIVAIAQLEGIKVKGIREYLNITAQLERQEKRLEQKRKSLEKEVASSYRR